MTERAAHLVDAVLPWVPVRQWVLTVPYPRQARGQPLHPIYAPDTSSSNVAPALHLAVGGPTVRERDGDDLACDGRVSSWHAQEVEDSPDRGCTRVHRCPSRARGYEDADQAPRGDLPGEPLVRRVLRDLSDRAQSFGPAFVPASPGHTISQRPRADPDRQESELVEAVPDRSHPVVHLRPGPRLHGGTESPQRRSDGPVPPLRRPAAQQSSPVLPQVERGTLGHRDGLLRRQYRHCTLELRAALRPRRQQLRDDVGAVDSRSPEPDGGRYLWRPVRPG